jgi:hypothetical protein
MTKSLSAVLAFLALGGLSLSQRPEVRLIPENEFHFGTVKRGPRLSHSFKMTNPYAVPVTINNTNIRTTCGCATATAKRHTLQSLESTEVEVQIDTRRFMGQKTVTVYVPYQPKGYAGDEIRLIVTATAVD